MTYTIEFSEWEISYSPTPDNPGSGMAIIWAGAFDENDTLLAGPVPGILSITQYKGPGSESLKAQVIENLKESVEHLMDLLESGEEDVN